MESFKNEITDDREAAGTASSEFDDPFRFSFGVPDKTVQRYDCSVQDLDGLLTLLSDSSCNPFPNWYSSDSSTRNPKADDLTTWFPSDEHVVFEASDEKREPLMYADVHELIKTCPPYRSNSPVVVAVLMPRHMMSEMAVVLVSLLAQPSNVCVAPLDPGMPHVKLREAFLQLECHGVITTRELFEELHEETKSLLDVRVVEPIGMKTGAIQWTVVRAQPLPGQPAKVSSDMTPDPPKLLLRTSGTTSLPKVVPITASSLLYNATCLASSLQLQRADVGCNAMPLFHIGGVSCALLAVLISGSSVCMMGGFDPEAFLDRISGASSSDSDGSPEAALEQPTWYYGVPSMHKTLILTAKARRCMHVPNKLRFVRSGAAHLPHETARELSEVFRTCVIPTYSMSECMPICSAHETPVVWDDNKSSPSLQTVGPPIGCSLCIVDEGGDVLPHGAVGEVALQGPGVTTEYRGVDRSDSHTPDGWLRTGDIGLLDVDGRLTLKGRVKEMIKRGGEQVWPNDIDRVVERVQGVSMAVAFAVPNELWGEEVAVAVVLDKGATDEAAAVQRTIREVCKEELDGAAVPSQVVLVPSAECLLKGPTGKYLRMELASHLQVEPVDNGALQALEGRVTPSSMSPSSALNGVRFITASFVVQIHIGLYPNNAWLKIQSFSLNMQIFFLLGAFQLACSIKNPVNKSWATFVGTKIGAMHALFVVTQFIALPSYLLFQCGSDGYLETFEDKTCKDNMGTVIFFFVVKTATGLLSFLENPPVNGPAWFQSVFYIFLMLFPPLDAHLRSLPTNGLVWRLVLNLLVVVVAIVFLYGLGLWILNFTILSWLPALVSAMIAGYFFTRSSADKHEDTTKFFRRPRVWGVITDALSVLFLVFEVITAMWPDCIHVEESNFLEMRPHEEVPKDGRVTLNNETYVYACDVSYDEFVEYVHAEADDFTNGRWSTPMSMYLGFCRIGLPFVLLWLYGMAHGQGWTARIMNLRVLQVLSPLAYPLYLLHVPIARYYWMITRGWHAENWWGKAALFPFPVEWYETLIIIGVCLLIGAALDRLVVSSLARYTVRLGVNVCKLLSRCFCGCQCRRIEQTHQDDDETQEDDGGNLKRVKDMVRRLTGNDRVTRSTDLRDLGLDSLGAAALLGTLRASVPAARKLTLVQLASFGTVSALVDFLDCDDDNDPSSRAHDASGDDVTEGIAPA